MNETKSSDSNRQISELQGELLRAGPPLWRAQIVRIIEILGVVAMFLGGAEFLNLISALPHGVAPQWAFLIGGVVNKTAKPAIEFFGDWFDDGVLNKSFRIGPTVGLIAVLAVLSFALSSCTVAFDPSTGRFGIQTDPQTVSDLVERLNRRLNERLEEAPPIAVPVVPAK